MYMAPQMSAHPAPRSKRIRPPWRCPFTPSRSRRRRRARQVEAGQKQGDRGREGGRGRKKLLPTERCAGVSGNASNKKRRGGVAEKLAQETGASERKVRQASGFGRHRGV